MSTRRNFRTFFRVFLCASAALVLFLPSSAVFAQSDLMHQGNQGNPRVFPPQSKPFGLSYGEWSVRWWQWAYSLPVAGHPLFDETGADCAAGQTGNVWFLGGIFNVSGSATRDLCAVPSGKALFFPILDVEWDNTCPPGSLTLDELRATAKSYIDLATDLECEVDGLPIKNVGSYRFTGMPFTATMPDGNIFQFFGCAAPAGTYGPMLPDGIFLMLAPLSPGAHTIHFKGTIGDPVNFTLDITYHLTVKPAGRFVAGSADAGAASSQGAIPLGASPARSSWGRLKTIYR